MKQKVLKTVKHSLLMTGMIFGIMILPADKVEAEENVTYGTKLTEGTCGAAGNESGVTWAVYDSDGNESGDILVLGGTGEMKNFYPSTMPWYSYITTLTTVEFLEDSDITYLGNYTFQNCTALASIEIADSVTELGYNVFGNCRSLTSITLPDSVTAIGSYSFSGCTGLSSITMSEGVTKIDWGAFSNCSSLETITIPGSVTTIVDTAFSQCNKLKICVADTNSNFAAEDGILYNKEKNTLIAYPAVSESFEIPEGVTNIGNYAFYKCTKLTSVKIPDNVVGIGKSAFYGCKGLNTVEIENGVTSVGEFAFYDCVALKDITIPESVTSIGESAFYGCWNLSSITIPKNITSIESKTFYGCTSLSGITIPENVTNIKADAFAKCEGMVIQVSDANPQYSSENGVLYNKDKSTLIAYPSASGSFTVPESVTSIGEMAFYGCTGLSDITISEKVTSIGNTAFYGCTKLTKIVIPESVTSIGNSVFNDCVKLQSVTIPESVTSIGKYAFSGCSELSSLIIPKDVTSIGSSALGSCKSLKDFYYPAGLDISKTGITKNSIQCSYEVLEDGTIALTVTNIPTGTTEITLPDGINGRSISSVDYADDIDGTEIALVCSRHYLEFQIDVENHWYADLNCEICGGIVETETTEKEAHNFGDGTQACKCGYVPFRIIEQPCAGEMIYGYEKGLTLSVVAEPTLKTEEITYQWYEGENAIDGATAATYTIPTGKWVEEYKYYCEISCGDYKIDSETVTIIVQKKEKPDNTPDAILTVGNSIKKVSQITLPENWEWTEEDADKELLAGGNTQATANYIADEKIFYNTISRKINITRAACLSGEILYTGEGEHAPTCTETGLGHKECVICGDILEKSIIVPTIEHIWDKGVVTKEPTETEKGIKTYTCSVCQKTKTEEIPALGKTEVTPTGEAKGEPTPILPEATPTEEAKGEPTPILAEVTPTEVPKGEPTPIIPETTPTGVPKGEPTPVIPEDTTPEVPKEEPTPEAAKGEITPKPTQGTGKEVLSAPKKGTILFDKKNQVKYKVLISGTKNGIVEYVKLMNKKAKKATVPAKVTLNGITYKVVSIGKNAFYGCKKLKTVSMGTNVTTIGNKAFYKCTALTKITIPSKVKKIGAQAFYGCKKLKTITIKTKKLTKKNVGSKAFKGIYKKATIKVPKSKVKSYKKMLKTKGIGKQVKVKK